MKSMKLLGLLVVLFSLSAQADVYSCAKMVYAEGWIKKYEYKGNTWGANTKKHGVLSSSVGSSVETTTGSVDPGVTTGHVMSSLQYSSSWGECSMLEMYITKKFRNDYIEQNIAEIKKQIALGEGHHITSLAFVSGCRGIDATNWSSNLRSGMAGFYDAKTGAEFSGRLDQMIQSDSSLSQKCSL